MGSIPASSDRNQKSGDEAVLNNEKNPSFKGSQTVSTCPGIILAA
jgi:hypothetical protein